MNKILQILSLIIVLTFTFTSCKKEEPLKPNNTNYIEDGYDVEGITWVLVDTKIYRDNLDNGDKDVYDHFGGTKVSSSMSIFGSSIVVMDSIHQNLTTWVFNNGTFTLNGSNTYGYTTYNNNVWTPNGLEGGTSRPIVVEFVNETSMTVKVHAAYGSDGINNFKFWTILTFVKAGQTCNNCVPDTDFGYTYGGVWSPPSTSTSTLVGTKWVVTRYNNGLSGNVYPNDTLDFSSQTQYTINSGPIRNYSLSNVTGNNNKSLSLYSFTTLGGDYSGQVIGTFIDDGIINNSQFVDMFNVNNTVTVWMERIQ